MKRNEFLHDEKLVGSIAAIVYTFGGKQGWQASRRILKFVNESSAVLELLESRPTVRRKPPVQQRKADMPICRKYAKCIWHGPNGYCGGNSSGKVLQLGCYSKLARSAVA
jgi:hypothetical protein